jgi:hypothetical protein
MYASPQILVPPCSSKKPLISEWDTYARAYQPKSDSWVGTSEKNKDFTVLQRSAVRQNIPP